MADSSRSRRRIVVHGHVQGVFFRDSIRRRAEQEGVSGWVRNRADGTVEAAFEGDPERIARLVAFCERGPRGARVERVERFDEESEGLTGFQVR
jgi:acylphosphatase